MMYAARRSGVRQRRPVKRTSGGHVWLFSPSGPRMWSGRIGRIVLRAVPSPRILGPESCLYPDAGRLEGHRAGPKIFLLGGWGDPGTTVSY